MEGSSADFLHLSAIFRRQAQRPAAVVVIEPLSARAHVQLSAAASVRGIVFPEHSEEQGALLPPQLGALAKYPLNELEETFQPVRVPIPVQAYAHRCVRRSCNALQLREQVMLTKFLQRNVLPKPVDLSHGFCVFSLDFSTLPVSAMPPNAGHLPGVLTLLLWLL